MTGGAPRAGWAGVLGLAALAAAVGLDVAAAGPLARLDAPVLAALREVRTPGLDAAVRAVTDLGGGWGRCAVAAVVVGALVARSRRDPAARPPSRGPELRWWAPPAAAAAALAVTPLLNEAVKRLTGRARPPVAGAVDVATGAAFPSGHAMGSAALAVVLAWLVARAARRRTARAAVAAAVVCAAAVGVSRTYLGVHWPTDVLAGWAAGAAVGWAVVLLTAPRAAVPLTANPAPRRGTGSR